MNLVLSNDSPYTRKPSLTRESSGAVSHTNFCFYQARPRRKNLLIHHSVDDDCTERRPGQPHPGAWQATRTLCPFCHLRQSRRRPEIATQSKNIERNQYLGSCMVLTTVEPQYPMRTYPTTAHKESPRLILFWQFQLVETSPALLVVVGSCRD